MNDPQTPFAGPESAVHAETGAKGSPGHLEAIIDRLAALTEPSREVDAMIGKSVLGREISVVATKGELRQEFYWGPFGNHSVLPPFTASLDAILDHLLPEGWEWERWQGGYMAVCLPEYTEGWERFSSEGHTETIDFCIACIKAKIHIIRARMEDE